LTVQRL